MLIFSAPRTEEDMGLKAPRAEDSVSEGMVYVNSEVSVAQKFVGSIRHRCALSAGDGDGLEPRRMSNDNKLG